jgi:PAS domain-containing protein
LGAGTVVLRAERVKYRLNKKSYELYMTLPVGIMLTDLGGEIMFANASALKLAGEAQLLGRNIRDILECFAIRKAEDIKEGANGQGYEGLIVGKPTAAGPTKSKVTFFVTRSKNGRFVFTTINSTYTCVNA